MFDEAALLESRHLAAVTERVIHVAIHADARDVTEVRALPSGD